MAYFQKMCKKNEIFISDNVNFGWSSFTYFIINGIYDFNLKPRLKAMYLL